MLSSLGVTFPKKSFGHRSISKLKLCLGAKVEMDCVLTLTFQMIAFYNIPF